ncbi:MAG TPA: type II secretion system F family protein [Candidatus Omnitrophota bacterium]|nr:type II secretion system F family protein [Candidatus Omnitrophota bacterium]
MATYIYRAKKSTAETVTGTVKAQSQDEAIDLINQLGLLPISVKPQEEREESGAISRTRTVSSKERYIFTKQLANLLKSGVTILRALAIIGEQTHNRFLRRVIEHIGHQIKNGKSLSQALSVYPNLFSSLYVTMVAAGEESGNLQSMLVSVAEYQFREEEIRSKVRMAVAYPILMLIVGGATIYFMLSFVLPKMSGLFANMGEQLPLPTQILLGVSKAINQWGLFGILAAVVGVFVVLQWAKSAYGKRVLSQFILGIPLIGDILLKTELARFCRTLVLLNQGGISLVHSLHIAIPILENEVVKNHLIRCKEALLAGGSFGETLKKSSQIPTMMGYMISVGEESGSLDEVLIELAVSFEGETNERIKVMTTLLEPVLILAIGVIVGFIVFAMLLPIFQLDIMSQG